MRAYYYATVLLMNYRALIAVVFGGKGEDLSNGSCTATSGQSKRKHKKESHLQYNSVDILKVLFENSAEF